MNEKRSHKSGISTSAEIRKHKKERNAKLLFEVHGLGNYPNLSKDGTGRYVCVSCKTRHLTELSYVRHREGKKHKIRLLKKETDESKVVTPQCSVMNLILRDKKGYAINIDYKLAAEMPTYRFVSSLEQNVEGLDDSFRYLVFVCKPYENIGIKFENKDIEDELIYEDINEETGMYRLHFYMNNESH